LVAVVEGREPLLVHVERASDILRVLDLRREFPALKLVLVGATEGWTVAPQIAAAKVPYWLPRSPIFRGHSRRWPPPSPISAG
jgi:hypothetical protein